MRQDFYRDIPGSQFFKQLQYLDSSGQEMCFRVERKTGSSLLLRLSPPDTYEEKRVEFKNLRRLYSLGIPMSYPQDLGFCSEGEYLYILFSDIQGQRADEVLPFLTPLRQYQLGISAGQILRKIHTLSPREPYDWDELSAPSQSTAYPPIRPAGNSWKTRMPFFNLSGNQRTFCTTVL